MIGGRLNGNTLADRICCAPPKIRPITARTLFAGPTRSSNGFSRVTIKAAFGWLPPSSRENPTIDSTASTWGIGRIRFSTCSTTVRVRSTDAPSGSCTTVKIAPWSSSGRNPVGVALPSMKMPAPAAAIKTTESAASRNSRATMAE